MKPNLTVKHLVLSVILLTLSACSPKGLVSTATTQALATIPSSVVVVASETPTESPLPTTTTSPTVPPITATATLTFQQWAQAVQPDAALLQRAVSAYTRTMNIQSNSVQISMESLVTPNGPVAIIKDSATGTPLLMSIRNENGENEWGMFSMGLMARDYNKTIGVEALGGSDSAKFTIIADEFNQMHITAMSWKRSQPSENETVLEIPQFYLQKALAAGETPTFAALVYGNSTDTPDWLRNGNYSREQAIAIMENHITAVMQSNRQLYNQLKAQGNIQRDVRLQYIVVNEGVNEPGYYWPGVIGPEYIELAFRAARAADPDALLIYNDFGHELPGGINADGVFQVVSNLKSQGLIDGVGMQMHFIGGPDNIDPNLPLSDLENGIRAQINRYSEIGVPVYITECDVDLSKITGTPEQRIQRATELYRMIGRIFGSSADCIELSIYGLNSESSWITEDLGGEAILLFSNYVPQPTYYATLTGFYEGLKALQP